MRLLLLLLIAIGLMFGTPYAAALLNRAMGPWTATAVERDGSRTFMRFDPDLAPPDFIPVFPGARVVQSSRVVSQAAPGGVGLLELAANGTLDEVQSFYRSRLQAGGFTVLDLGTQGLNDATAAYLGLDRTLVGKRPASDDIVTIQIRSEEGILMRSRLLQLSWRKISDWPAGQPLP